MLRIACVVGARPNFMQMGPVVLELRRRATAARGIIDAAPVLVHTGQHYDANMSQVFFDELGLPAPDVHLGAGSGSQAKQTGSVMVATGRGADGRFGRRPGRRRGGPGALRYHDARRVLDRRL